MNGRGIPAPEPQVQRREDHEQRKHDEKEDGARVPATYRSRAGAARNRNTQPASRSAGIVAAIRRPMTRKNTRFSCAASAIVFQVQRLAESETRGGARDRRARDGETDAERAGEIQPMTRTPRDGARREQKLARTRPSEESTRARRSMKAETSRPWRRRRARAGAGAMGPQEQRADVNQGGAGDREQPARSIPFAPDRRRRPPSVR